MKRLTALVASLFMLTGGLALVVAPSASAEGGDAWFQSNATPTWETWVPIAYGDGKFVSLSSGSNATTFSPDGKNWYTGGTATTVDLREPAALAYGGGRFVSVAVNSTATMWSDDAGASWNPGGAAPAPSDWSAITYGNGRFVAVAGDANADTRVTMWSVDGTAWSPAPVASDLYGVAYGNGVFVAVGDSLVSSADGTQWQTATKPAGFNAGGTVAFGNGRFVATDAFGKNTIWSTDGKTWQLGGSFGPGVTIGALTFGAASNAYGRFVAISPSELEGSVNDSSSWWSTDGVSWTQGGALPNFGSFSMAFGESVLVYTSPLDPVNQMTYSEVTGLQDVISVSATVDGTRTNWVNGGSYEVPFGSTINFVATSTSGGAITGPYVYSSGAACVASGLTLTVNVSIGQICKLGVDAVGGNDFLPSYQQVKYYVVVTAGHQQPRVMPRASGQIRSGQVVHLETASQNGTNLGQPIMWKITRGNGKACSLEKGRGKAVGVRLQNRGTCTVVGTAPADSSGTWDPLKVKRTYKVT